LSLKVLADESVNFDIVKQLRELNYEVHAIVEEKRSAKDLVGLEYAKELKALLLTEDKDFGEWIFAYHVENLSVVLLRYRANEFQDIVNSLKQILQKYGESLYGKFVVIKKNKFRIREL
jgi:predicted nuclease of predicted toxin-antitoxin system